MNTMNTVISTTENTNTENQEVTMKTRKPRTVVEPLTKEEHKELQEFLIQHNFCIKRANKNIRVYRFLGMKKGKMLASRDFVYVVGADAYRADKKAVQQDILKNSKKVFDKQKLVKNEFYANKMVQLEEDLLMNHKIAMQWRNSKSVRFYKYNHVITDEKILAPLNKFVKGKSDNFVTNRIYESKDKKHLAIFQEMAQIFEEFEGGVPFYDWKSFRYVTRNGKVVAAYSRVDMSEKMKKKFKKGIQDKFDYNLNVMNKDYINEVVNHFGDKKVLA